MENVPVSFSGAVIKLIKSNLVRKSLFGLQATVILWGCQGSNKRQEPGGRN